jgi:hypothetical protein
MPYRPMLVILLILVSLTDRLSLTSAAQGTTYSDPFAYCAAVGTIDAPDARYSGPSVPDEVARGLRTATQAPPDAPLDQFRSGSFWRCMDGKVYACTVGANLPCQEQANTSQAPTAAMTNYCRTNPNGDIPAFVTGRATIYAWSCANGVATSGRQVAQVDDRGFLANIWYAISTQGAPETQILPGTGGASTFGGRILILLVLGVMAALLGVVARRRAEA